MLLHRSNMATTHYSDDQPSPPHTPPSPARKRSDSASPVTLEEDAVEVERRNRKRSTFILLRYLRKSTAVILLCGTSFAGFLHAAYNFVITIKENEGKTPGVIVLGMHRSGTSMLSGLLVEGFKYDMGDDIMKPSFDNEKGFYENNDVVTQNDEFLLKQRASWSSNLVGFNPDKALEQKAKGKLKFKDGKQALQFLNKYKFSPYLLKDPRLCITLPIWLNLVDEEPAIVFTYRHPLEVAMSLKSRGEEYHRQKVERKENTTVHNIDEITMEKGLLLWVTYNVRALQYSLGLCRVYTSNEAVYGDPQVELQRINDELMTKCNMIQSPNSVISLEVVNSFVDAKLQHNKKNSGSRSKQKILKDYGNGCKAIDFKSDYEEKSAYRKAEVDMYLIAMQLFCDMENGHAYKDDYTWPDLTQL
jgi:hypothetical protein